MSDKSLDEKKQEFGENDFGEKEGFGAENVESYAVENDAEMVSVSSSNKRIKEMSIDRLSALPDGVLIHILSFLWSVKEAAITSVLSKRWQFLWSELPRLRFREDSKETEKIREFVAMVSRTLLIRCGIHLEKFKVCFMYDESFASDIDIWVEFAVKNKVKEVSLQLNSEDDLYTLPEIMYFNSSLTRLSVRGCLMDPLRTIEWKSLTSLDINDAELPQHVIENILTSCPVLHSLVLGECWGFNCLEVNSQNLYKLKVHDREDGDNGPLLEISAPYICTLDILFYPEGRKLQLRNITSIVRADFDFTGYWFFTSEEVRNTTKELFEIIKHVKELELGRQYFKVLSELAVNGWQLPKSMRRCLTVVTFSEDEHNISGILALLESSPNLESLVIEGFEPEGDTWDQTARGDLNCDLLHLKTIKISDFADPIFGGEPMLTLARILLKRATVLEEMAIRIRVEDISDFIKMGQILLTYPRSSEKAVIRLP